MHFKKINIKNKFYNYYNKSDKKLETKNILIDDKNYKDVTIYFTRYDHGKSIFILNLYYHELMEKIEEYEGKNIRRLTIIC